MRPLILLLLTFLSACGTPKTEYVYLNPVVAEETLTPCDISDRQARTVNELAILATEHLRSAECANSKITTIATIIKPNAQ